ncbi:MAG: hypothetical protein ACJ780_16000, partial [Solirubrobacteraceae bacterium]
MAPAATATTVTDILSAPIDSAGVPGSARAPPAGATLITAAAGGSVTSGDATLTFAPGSLPADTYVSIVPTNGTGTVTAGSAAYDLLAVDAATGAQIHLFRSAPVLQLTTPASASALYYEDPVAGPVAVPSSYDISTGVLTAALPHFSIYETGASPTIVQGDDGNNFVIVGSGSTYTVSDGATTTAMLTFPGSGTLTISAQTGSLASVTVSGTLTLNGGLTILAKMITLNNATISTSGAVTLTASDTNNGSATLGVITGANPDAEITLNGSTIAAGAVALTAMATSLTDSSGHLPLASITSSATARVLMLGSSWIKSSGDVTLSATVSDTATAAPDLLPGSGLADVDAAVAVTTITTKAITGVSDASFIQAGGALTIAALNTTLVTTTGDASRAAAGAGIAVATVRSTTKAYIDAAGAQPTTGSTISVTADTNDSSASTADANSGGASSNDPGDDPETLTNGYANIKDQNDASKPSSGIKVAAALAFTLLNGDTEAYVIGSNDLQTPGELLIHSSSVNSVPTTADGSSVSVSAGSVDASVGVAVAIDVDNVTTKAYVGGTAHLQSPTITVEAPMPADGKDDYMASATSGHGDAETLTIAGSLGLTVLTIDREATLLPGSLVSAAYGAGGSLSGDVALRVESDASSEVKGLAYKQAFDPTVPGVVTDSTSPLYGCLTSSACQINLAYKLRHGGTAELLTGDEVIYHNGFDTSIGGLTDGGHYFVIVTADDPLKKGESVELASTKAFALAGAALPLDPTVASGEEQTLTPVDGVDGTGIGASFAINIVNDSETSAIGDGTTLSGAHNVTIEASTGDEMGTEASSGAEGKVAITPVVAVSISNVTTLASIGTPGAGAAANLTVSGKLDVTATQKASVTTSARGELASSSAGIGASIAITTASHTARAVTHRDIHADEDVSFTANGASSTQSDSLASAMGANTDSGAGDVNGQANDQLNHANGQAPASGKSMDASTPQASAADGPSSSGVSAAASITFNLVHATSDASLPEGLTITAGGPLTLSSSANTDATADADGEASTLGGQASVGVGVGINLVHVVNTANLLPGDNVASKGLTLSAVMNPTGGGGSETTPTHSFGASVTSGAWGSATANINGALALNIIDVNTSASLLAGQGTPTRGPPIVDAQGGPVSMTATSVVSSTTQAFPAAITFDPTPNAGGVIGCIKEYICSTIVLPFELLSNAGIPVKTGDQVTYHSGGGQPIGGLKDGQVYTAVVQKPGYISLLDNGVPVPLDPTVATGTKHTLELTNGGDSKVGVGASVAVNLVNDTTTTGALAGATAAEGAQLIHPGDISLTSTDTDALVIEAEGGADGGVAIAPTVAVSIPNVTTTASFGAGPAIDSSGKIDAKAEQETDLDSSAKGDFTGSKVGIGISLSLAIPTDIVDASSARDLTGTDLAFEASGASKVNGVAWASGQGESDSSSSGEDVNGKADSQLNAAKSTQMADTGKTTSASKTPAATDSDNGGASLSLAAAVTINIVTTSSTASFADGTHITAEGPVTLKTAAHTTVLGESRGDTKTSAKVGIGAAVTINVINLTNTATTGAATLESSGLDIEAGMGEIAPAYDPVWRYVTTVGIEPAWDLIDSGPQLPTAPSENEFFNLTAQSGVHAPGVYKYENTHFPIPPLPGEDFWTLQTVTGVDELPESAASNTLDQLAAHQFQAVSTSGASDGTSVVIAGSLAMNIVSQNHTEAVVKAGSEVTAGADDVTVTATSNETDTANAKATADGASEKKSSDSGGGTGDGSKDESGNSVGVGASVALNILTDDVVRAEVEDTATLSGGTGVNLGSVDIEALARRTVKTSVEAGVSETSVSVAPAVALVVLTSDIATARLGTSSEGLIADGPITIHARHIIDAADTEGSADAAGSKVAVGADISINVVIGWSTLAELGRNVTGSAVAVLADSEVNSGARTKASAKGTSDSGGDADSQANGQLSGNPNTKSTPTLPSAGSQTSKANSSSSSQSGEGGGSVSIAAAIAVNWVEATNTAKIDAGVAATAIAGAVQVEAVERTLAVARAIGLSFTLSGSSNANIAAAVGFNYQEIANRAVVGTGAALTSSAGHDISVEAITPDGAMNKFTVWGIAGSGGKSKASVAASIGIQVIYYDTTASVGAGSTLTSGGGVTVTASDPRALQDLILSAGLSIGGVAVGGSFAVNLIGAGTGVDGTTDHTKAYIDSGTGTGAETGIAPTTVIAPGAIEVSAAGGLGGLVPDLSLLGINGLTNSALPFTLPAFSSVAVGGG